MRSSATAVWKTLKSTIYMLSWFIKGNSPVKDTIIARSGLLMAPGINAMIQGSRSYAMGSIKRIPSRPICYSIRRKLLIP